ncbi:MAG TPA: DUF5658 family protein [Gemmataceae bacterium]|jgi:hypothetical protein|nr:DUF5658 family protein [Gemmataceae bacterium]
MSTEPENDKRSHTDRRQEPTSPWAVFRLGGQRMTNRRDAEHRGHYYVDRFGVGLFVWIMALLLLTVADGVITLNLLDGDCGELNPVMQYLLSKGHGAFFLGKYALTVVGLPVLLIFKNHYLFRTRFRVGYLIPMFVGLYAVLLSYQLVLLNRLFPG